MKRIIMALIIALSIPMALQSKTVEELQQQSRMLAEYYKMAMESFYKGDYTAAIRQWEEILKIDSQQAQAQQLIEFARQKMSEKMKPMAAEVESFIQAGEYTKALEKNLERLALDSANSAWKKLGSKLDKVARILPSNTEKGKPFDMARKGTNAYLAEKEDARLALNACRYASQLKPDNTRLKDLKELMESEYSVLAQTERAISGSDVVEQKLQSSLSNIYDGKYDRAILECNDILALEPNNVMAMKRAGSAYYALGNKKQAMEVWQRAAKLAPNDPDLKKVMRMKK